MNIELGDKVADDITGFEGTTTGRFEYLNGCVRWDVTGTDKEGLPVTYTFDQEQLGRIGTSQAAKAIIDRRQPTGGPRTAPARR